MSDSFPPQSPGQPRPYAYGAPPPQGGYLPGPPPPPARRSRALWIVAAVVAAALAVGGVLFLGGDGGGEDPADEVALTPHPTLEPVDFPDARALGYEAGPEAACSAVSQTMLARNYEFQSAETDEGGIECHYNTPGASTLEDGDYSIMTNVHMAVGDQADEVYDRFSSVIRSSVGGGGENMTWSPLYEFPVGDEGWIVHNQNLQTDMERGDGTASFRQGDTAFHIVVYGWIGHPDGANEPLTEEITFREITDIVRSLGGASPAGEPQISPSPAVEYPGLEDFGDPLLPVTGTAEERCAAVTAVAVDQLDVQLQGASVSEEPDDIVPQTDCVYEPSEAAYGRVDVGIRNIRIHVEDLSRSDAMYPAGELGADLRFAMEELRDSPGAGPLRILPAGTSGYLVYEDDGSGHGNLRAGYVVGDHYVDITLGGFYNAGDFDTRALTEEEMVADLSLLLTAMAG
ncbi:hypothetical protein [Streptomyces sp. RFCAC02]|uniref:hypothetical protein n=1 Tax=Streptomyces sp. RFCAC02 TaxID=2499143 RepID=UPI0010211BF6|nr:hypothetical protein [Streptomyces sp. RFCAC02]